MIIDFDRFQSTQVLVDWHNSHKCKEKQGAYKPGKFSQTRGDEEKLKQLAYVNFELIIKRLMKINCQ